MEWIQAPDLEPYRQTGGRQIVAEAIGTLERYVLSEAAREDYLSSYEGTRFAESMAYVRTYPTDLPILGDLLPEIQTPALIINGARDPFVPPVNAEYLHARLPKSKLAILDTGHFTWEDTADEYAALVTGWWSGGYAAVGRRPAG
jgi:pimeloyl-ACP methyl ester carboxylesterase